MKQICRFLSIAAMAALAFSACTEELNNENINGGKTVTVHFGTENTDPSTKATLTPNEGETAFQAAWENGDELKVKYSNDSGIETATGTTTATWKSTSFESTMPEYTGMWIYDAAYPVPASDNSVDFGPNRTQKGNAYNSRYDIMIGSAVAENAAAGKDDSGKDIVFQMTRQTAIAYFHFTSALDEAVTSATLTVSGEGAAIASNYAYVSDFAWAAAKDCQSITITFPEEAPNAQDFQLWFNVLPTTYTKMTLIVETATKRFTISNTKGGSYTAGKLYKVKKENISWAGKGGSDTPSTVTDVITAAGLTATSSSYADFSNKTFSSSAVYAGNSAVSTSSHIQLRSKNSNSGIVTTTSGGKVRKITIVWSKDNTADRTLDVYGKNTPYESAANLYASKNADQGTKLGSLNSTDKDTELTITGDYSYVGVRSNDNALQLESISIEWESGSSEPAPDTYSVSCASVTGGTLSASPVKAEAGAEVTLTATPDAEYTFNNDWTVTNAESSEVITVTDGKFTMPAANVNVSASFTQKTYTITANTAKNGTYTVKVGDAVVTSAVKGAKVVLEATPAQGYICDGWTVVDAESNSVYVSNNSFTMPASAVTISTTFSVKPEDITYDHAGTAEDPYSVADVLKFISTLGTATSTNDVYAKGVITSITEVSTKYGNATYTIKDEGVENKVLVFRGLYLDGADFTREDQIRVGDEVVVKGKVKNYNDTPEFDSGNSLVSYLNVSANKTSIDATGETVTITVNTNVDSWKATSNNEYFAVGTQSVNTVDVVVSENTDPTERTATITVTAGTLSKTITLTQSVAGTAVTAKQYTLTITPNSFNTTSYAANNNDKTTQAVAEDGSTIDVIWYSNQIMLQSNAMQWQKNNAYLYNKTDLGEIKSVTVNSTAGTFTTYYGSTQNPTSGTIVGGGYFNVKVGSATGKTNSVVVVFKK